MTDPQIPKAPRLGGIFLFFALLLLANTWLQYRHPSENIPYSQFIGEVQKGNVSEVTIGSTEIYGQWKQPPAKQPKEFVTFKLDDPTLTQKLQNAGVKFSGIHESSGWGFFFFLFPLLIFFLFWPLFSRRAGGMPRGGGLLSMGKSKAKVYMQTDLKTRFEDVAGVDEAKEELLEIVNFLKDPKRYSKLGGRMPKGVLLLGPPGTGKTLLARAVAGEAEVPFFSINGSEFVELFVGLGATRVRDLFAEARAKAPCIVFIDELDALGRARGLSSITGSANDEKEQTLNQLLAEMDGFDPSVGIILIAATNRPEVLDPALLRAGRFDRQILVDKPDRLGREKILAIHLKNKTLSKDIDIPALASMTAGFSGADLSNLANEAALIATRRAANLIELRDFTEAIERVVAGLERKNRLLSPEEKKRVAYHEMGHAVVALTLGENEVVHKVSIIPRGFGALGYTLRRPTEDRYLMTKGELENKMAIAMGGRAAEILFFSDISTGAGDDLDKATDLARAMITRYGMDKNLGLAVFEKETMMMLGGQAPVRSFDYSETTAKLIDQSIQNLMNHALEVAKQIIESKRDMMNEAAALLITRETLDESGLKEIWQRYLQKAA